MGSAVVQVSAPAATALEGVEGEAGGSMWQCGGWRGET